MNSKSSEFDPSWPFVLGFYLKKKLGSGLGSGLTPESCFIIFTKQTLTDDFWGLHKNVSCAFPLNQVKPIIIPYCLPFT